MKKYFYVTLLSFLLLGLGETVQAQASLVEILPENTVLFLSLKEAKSIEPQAIKTVWGQFCQLPGMQKTCQEWQKESAPLFRFLDGFTGQKIGVVASDILQLFQGEISFALLLEKRPHWIFSCSYAQPKEFFTQMFAKMFGPATSQTLGAHSISVYQGGAFCVYFADHRLFVSDSSQHLQNILAQLSKPTQTFSKSETYQKHHTGNEYCSLFFQITPLLRMVPPETQMFLELLGLHTLEAASLSYGYEGEYLQWTGKLSFNATPSGLFSCTPEQALQKSSFRHLRGPVTSVLGMSCHLKNWFDFLENSMRVVDPNAWEFMKNRMNENLWKEIGLTIEELVSLFGSALTSWEFSKNGATWSLMALELQSPEIFEKMLLPRLDRVLPVRFLTKTYRGVTLYQIASESKTQSFRRRNFEDLFAAQGLSLFGIPTNFMIYQNHLIFASLPQALKDYLDSEASYTGNGPLAHLDQQLQGKLVSSLSYAPIRSVAQYRNGLHFLKRFESVIRTFGVPIHFGNFPRAKEVLPFIRPSSFDLYWDQNILKMDLKIGFPLTLDQSYLAVAPVAGPAIIAAIAIPGLLQARISSNETSAIGTLRTLSTSQNQFQNANVKDRDLDGVGEYGFFTELSGTLPVPVGESEGYPAKPAFMSPVLGESSVQKGGIAAKSGYYFVLYLPSGSEAGPIRENGQAVPPVSYEEMTDVERDEINAQETRWCAFAWPISAGNSGYKAFFMNQSGEVIATSNLAMGSSSFYYSGLERIPQPSDIFNMDSGNDIDGELFVREPSSANLIWAPLW